MLDRYLIPAIGVFWFLISIIVGKIKNNALLIITLAIILFLGIYGFHISQDYSYDSYIHGYNDQNFLDKINNNDTVIIILDDLEVIQLGSHLNNALIFYDNHTVYDVNISNLKNMNIFYYDNIHQIIEDNSDKEIFIILHSVRSEFNDDLDKYKVYNIGKNEFYKLNI